METISVQDLMQEHLLEVGNEENNEMLQLMNFTRESGVAVTNQQSFAVFMLREMGLNDIASYVLNIRKHMTPTKRYLDVINKLTLADRIKGNAKLSNILKANANPNNSHPPVTMGSRNL